MSRNLPDRRTRVPEIFNLMFGTGVLRVTREDAYALWDALCRSQWSEPIALRGLLSFHRLTDMHTEADGLRFLHEQLAPQRLVRVLEALVTEGQLGRPIASRLETAIFARMTSAGTWTKT